MAAHTATNCWEVAAAVDNLHGVSEVTLCKLGYPVGNIVAYRATLLAAGHLAVQAALSLAHSLGYGIVFGNFLEIIFHLKFVLVLENFNNRINNRQHILMLGALYREYLAAISPTKKERFDIRVAIQR
jgi:hypothetical protein